MTVNVNYGGSTTGWQGAPAGNDPISVALNAYAIGAKLPASFGSDIVSITFQVNSIYKWSDFGLSGPPPVPPNATCPPGSYPEADSSQPSGYRCIESSVGGTNQPGTAASSGTSTGAKVAAALAVPALVAAGIGAHALATGGTYAGSAKAAWGGTKSFAVGGLQRLSALKVPL